MGMKVEWSTLNFFSSVDIFVSVSIIFQFLNFCTNFSVYALFQPIKSRRRAQILEKHEVPILTSEAFCSAVVQSSSSPCPAAPCVP